MTTIRPMLAALLICGLALSVDGHAFAQDVPMSPEDMPVIGTPAGEPEGRPEAKPAPVPDAVADAEDEAPIGDVERAANDDLIGLVEGKSNDLLIQPGPTGEELM